MRDALVAPLELKYPALSLNHLPDQTASIVLLGGGITLQSLEYDGHDELGKHSMLRTIYAAKIAEHSQAIIIPTGGMPHLGQRESEAGIMKRWLIWFGVDESRIHIESQANTTWENAKLSKPLLNSPYMQPIYLVTSATHMPRAVWCFQQQGLKVIPAPTDYSLTQTNYDLKSFIPHWNVLNDSSTALHEYLGLAWYWLKYS